MKNVLIFGASSDLGISLVKYLEKKGYHVIGTYNNHPVKDFIKCDVTSSMDVDMVISDYISKYGHIDIIINMAATYMDNLITDKDISEFMDILRVNVGGAYNTSRIYSQYINDGLIINIASTDGIDTYNEYNIDYGVSKAALIQLTKHLSVCTKNKVLALAPNWIDTASTRSLDETFLTKELKRINQTRLIKKSEFNECIYELINSQSKSGSVYRLDVKGDKICRELM